MSSSKFRQEAIQKYFRNRDFVNRGWPLVNTWITLTHKNTYNFYLGWSTSILPLGRWWEKYGVSKKTTILRSYSEKKKSYLNRKNDSIDLLWPLFCLYFYSWSFVCKEVGTVPLIYWKSHKINLVSFKSWMWLFTQCYFTYHQA